MGNYDLNLYKVFCAVAENKSISKAAEALFISRQSVSYNIKQLENALGNNLFFRTSKGVALTPEAEKLYSNIKQSLNSIKVSEEIFKEDKELNSGHIYIGCNPSFFNIYVHHYIKVFHELYPNIQFHFLNDPFYKDMAQMLREHEIDMFFYVLAENNNINNFSKKVFDKVSHCFVCNKDFKFLSDKKKVSLEEITNYPLLLLHNDSYIRKCLENSFKEKNINSNPLIEFVNLSPIIKSVKNGVGIGYVIRELVAEDLKTGELFEIPVDGVSYEKDMGVIYDKNHLTFVASKFIEML